MNTSWFVIATHLDFYKNVDKLLRDNFKYVQCCLLCLIEQVSDMAPQLTTKVVETFKIFIQQHGTSQADPRQLKSVGIQNVQTKNNGEYANLRGDMLLMLAFNEMVNSSSFKQRLVKRDFVEMLAHIIEICEERKSVQMDEFRRATFAVVESLSKHIKLLTLHQTTFLDKVLPALAGKIESETADVRFIALKVFTDYVTQYMCEEKIYQPQENN